MRATASWCVRHRRIVLAAWLLVLLTMTGASRAAGSRVVDSWSLPGTDSSTAATLLTSVSPAVSGDTEQVVVATSGGLTVRDPAVRGRFTGLLTRLSKLDGVTGVVSPYGPADAAQVSKDGRVAFATLQFGMAAQDVPEASGQQMLHDVKAASTPDAVTAVTGQVAENSETPPPVGAGLGILAAAVVLALVFGSVTAMLLPLISALLALGTALGIVGLLSHVMNVASSSSELILLVGLGVGVDYALFIVVRHRQGLLSGKRPEESIAEAVNTSGRAVLFAGTIVCISVLGMFALRVNFFYGMAAGTAIGVALTMSAALTLLPAMLGFLGTRVLSRRQRRRIGQPQPERPDGFWVRWAAFIARRPAVPAVLATAVIAMIAIPVLSLSLGFSDQGNDPSGTSTRQAYDLLAEGFGPGFNGPLELVSLVPGPAARAALDGIAAKVGHQPDVASAAPPRVISGTGGREVALIVVYPASSPQDQATTALVQRLRSQALPRLTVGTGLRFYITGSTAVYVDFAHVLAAKLALFIGAIVGLSFIVLAVVFRSLVIPLTAAVMNLLSAAASFGVLVAVFQWGWAAAAIGVEKPGPVESIMPVLLFPVLFGLSMDYQVFLLTRIHEAWQRHRDNRGAVRDGLAATGGIITAAALIMIVVFAAFMLEDNRDIKEFGLGLAAAVLMDAVVIRAAVVPALMILAGRSNWWFPRRLDRILPRLSVEDPDAARLASPDGARSAAGETSSSPA
jgi:putative drug exporter of the RND superfamily